MLSRKVTLIIMSLLLLLQLVVRPAVSYVNPYTGQLIAPDFILLAVIFAGLGRGVLWGVVMGFLFGIAQDSFVPMYFGVNALSKVVAAFVAGRTGGRVFLNTGTVVFLLILGLKYLNDVIVMMFKYLDGFETLISQFAIYSPGSSLYTAVLGLLFLYVTILLRAGSKEVR